MKILLQYGENKKVKELTDISELHDVIQQLFTLQPFTYFLQKFNHEFEDFIDMEENENIEDKDKIKIIPLNMPQVEPPVPNYTCSLTFSGDTDPTQIPCESIVEELQDFVVLPPHTQKWPDFISLPTEDFSKGLLEDLHNEKQLSWDKKRELIGHLANYAYSFKPYPNKAERLDICNLLVSEFPYLKNNIGIGAGGWELKLLNKLKKIRQADTSLEVKLNRNVLKVAGTKVPNINPKKEES